jgi:carbon monoxide dehydrogenase subunit G
MKLSFSGAPEISASLEAVWPRISDPHFVARHGPGVESVEVVDPTHFKVITGFGIGSIKLRFGIDVELTEVTPPTGMTMKARGRAPGSAVEVTAALALESLEGIGTRLNWKAETEISGTVASVGARLMEGTARRLTEQFWSRFADSIAADAPVASPAPTTPPPPLPTAAPVATPPPIPTAPPIPPAPPTFPPA